jgi:IPT/TIG domain-containing protein
MSLHRSGCVGALLLAAVVAACADRNDSPVAPVEPSLAVTGLNPASGSITGGTAVAVVGSGFRDGTSVTFGGLAALRVRVITTRLMQVIAPAHGPGDVEVVVTSPEGLSTSPVTRFRYIDDTQGPGPWDY